MAASKRSRGALELKANLVPFHRNFVAPVQEFIHIEWVGSAFLLAAAVVAMVWANSPWSDTYFALLHQHVVLDLKVVYIDESIAHFVNDGLMAVFFFVVGLEMKREVLHGGLSDLRAAALPGFAAVGGMVVPAVLYLAFNSAGEAQAGWGIPMATDIAFALGVIGLVGKGIPSQVRLFLLALAIVDDLGAILVIAIFYTDTLALDALLRGFLILVFILGMQRAGVRSIVAYWVVGFFFWAQILESGIHATIAGVVLGALTPATAVFTGKEYVARARELLTGIEQSLDADDHSRAETALGKLELVTVETEAPLERLERMTHPWSAYVILPIFALANAGVQINADSISAAVNSPVTLGIVVGLVAGKILGVVGFSAAAVKLGLAQLPSGVRWSQVMGAGMLAGIGFTMSIFITGLAFDDPDLVNQAKIGILAASLAAGIVGYVMLKLTTRGAPRE